MVESSLCTIIKKFVCRLHMSLLAGTAGPWKPWLRICYFVAPVCSSVEQYPYGSTHEEYP